MATQPPATPNKLSIHPVMGMLMFMFAVLFDIAQIVAFFMLVLPDVNLFQAAVGAAVSVVAPTAGSKLVADSFSGGPAMAIGVSWYIGIVALIGLGIWLAMLNTQFLKKSGGKKLAILTGVTVVEFLPIFNALPFLSIGTFALLAQTYMDDLGLKIGLVDVALMLIPGTQGLAAARIAGVAAKTAKVAETTAAAAKAEKAAVAARNARRATRQSDVGPGVKKAPRQIDINKPYRREQQQDTSGFAQPYVPQNDEEAEEEGRWVA